MEVACRFWFLRHAFDNEEHAAWYRTIYLQFGFTQRSIRHNLTVWLAQGAARPVAVSSLLSGSHLQSSSFEILWGALRDLRRRNRSEAKVRNILAKNPWVLPDWTSDLCARGHGPLGIGHREHGRWRNGDILVHAAMFGMGRQHSPISY